MLEKYLPDLVRPAGLYEQNLLYSLYFCLVVVATCSRKRGRCVGGLYRGRDPSYPPSSTRVIVARYEAVGSNQARGHGARRGWSAVMSTVCAHDIFKNGGVEKKSSWAGGCGKIYGATMSIYAYWSVAVRRRVSFGEQLKKNQILRVLGKTSWKKNIY